MGATYPRIWIKSERGHPDKAYPTTAFLDFSSLTMGFLEKASSLTFIFPALYTILHAPLYDELGTENISLYDGARGTRLSPSTIQYTITLRGMKHSDCNECEVYCQSEARAAFTLIESIVFCFE